MIPSSRVKNTKPREQPYSHTCEKDKKNMAAAVKRNSEDMKSKMKHLWEICGVPSVFFTFNELEGTEVLVEPSNSEARPKIPDLMKKEVINMLKQSLKFHPKNLGFKEYDVAVISISEAIELLKEYKLKQTVNPQYAEILTLATGLVNRLSSYDMNSIREKLNATRTSIGLFGGVDRYIMALYIVMMITVVDIDDLELGPHILKKVLPTQRMVKTVFLLASEAKCTEVTNEMLAGSHLYQCKSDTRAAKNIFYLDLIIR